MKVEAIRKAPEPTNVHELKSYLGMLNYYSKFLPNLSHELSPLYDLLKKDTKWNWTSKQKSAFDKTKKLLSSDKLLVHFDPQFPVVLTCDASPRGRSAILSHTYSDGTGRPIVSASRSLDKAERNYSQFDKEALALIFGIRKLHKYVFGRHITIKTDHKPLLGLLGENKSIPEHASSRVQRWAIIMSAYNYKLEYVPGHRNNADALSRLPLPNHQHVPTPFPEDLHHVFQRFDDSPITSAHIAAETSLDLTLRQVYKFCALGWPAHGNGQLRPYFIRKSELSIDNGCVLWGIRVVIPPSLQQGILSLLHEEHIGITRMKMLARSYVWWPKLDSALENMSKSCFQCQSLRNAPPHAPLHSWNWPSQPWSRLHIDFAGPFLGHMFLIIVDAHSKWLEVRTMKRITAQDTIFQLRSVFAVHGLPDRIMSDNGPTFTRQEFLDFICHNGIEHIKSAPYHPSTNGLAERAVATFKSALKKMSKGTIPERVNIFLIKYRSTPQTTTGVTPAELLLGRKIKTRLDLVHDHACENIKKHLNNQKYYHDAHAKAREFTINDNVFVQNQSSSHPKYLPGTIVEKTDPISYKVMVNGLIKRYHVDQILPTEVDFASNPTLQIPSFPYSREKGEGIIREKPIIIRENPISATNDDPLVEEVIPHTPQVELSEDTPSVPSVNQNNDQTSYQSSQGSISLDTEKPVEPKMILRRSQRTIKKSDKLTF